MKLFGFWTIRINPGKWLKKNSRKSLDEMKTELIKELSDNISNGFSEVTGALSRIAADNPVLIPFLGEASAALADAEAQLRDKLNKL